MDYKSIVFREFTPDSIRRIERYRKDEAERITYEQLEQQAIHDDSNNIDADHRHYTQMEKRVKHDPLTAPNRELAVGQTLPRSLQTKFPAELIGKPIEEIDWHYRTEYVFVVINRNMTIFRFSSSRACFILSPFNLMRRIAIRILIHSLFSTVVMLTILANCIVMTMRNAPEVFEYIFTVIYTLEALTKCVARGFILSKYTFLRDPWNWLDFIVITFAYITFFVNLGNVAVLRTFRVLRALKTVAVVPGLKTIVDALIQSFIGLRDVTVLSSFILSIFALVGLQLYMGVLRQKCVPTFETFFNSSNFALPIVNMTYEWYLKEIDNETYWLQAGSEFRLCGNASGSTRCPDGYVCWKDRGISPNYGYTSFDNYGWAMLSCFRLMTQDYWENLYQLVLTAAGRYHFFYFVAVIFFGSFYLINLILAIVSMCYQDQQKKLHEEAAEKERRKVNEDLEQQGDGTIVPTENFTGSNAHLHDCSYDADNVLVFENMNRHTSNSNLSIDFETCRQKQHGQLKPLIQSTSWTCDRIDSGPEWSIPPLVNPTTRADSIGQISYDTAIPFIDETEMNSVIYETASASLDMSEKAARPRTLSHLSSERSIRYDESNLTLSEAKTPVKCTPVNDLMTSDEVETTCNRSKDNNANNTCDRPLMKLLRTYCCECGCPSPLCHQFQAIVAYFVLDAFVDLFIIICIVLNTLFMALDQPGQSETATRILTTGNYVFTAIFTTEAVLKIIAMTPAKYLKDGWNVFDVFIVTLSLVELGLANVKGLSVLRSFRLLRVFKLAKSWATLNRLMAIISKTIGALGNLTFVLAIIIFIFAVVGMQLFGQQYSKKFGNDIPRWNFVDFFHSFLIVFRVLCGEWIESMWVCLECAGWPCIPFFLFTFLIGNLVILNLFLALLLASFGSSSLSGETEKDDEGNKIGEAIDRIQRFFRFLRRLILRHLFCRRQIPNSKLLESVTNVATEKIEMQPIATELTPASAVPDTRLLIDVPPDCCPRIILKPFLHFKRCIPKPVRQTWISLRTKALRLVEHRFFEWLIIFSILASSTALALEDINTRQQATFYAVLIVFDKIFTIIFTAELLLKWFAYGIKNYFASGWNWLDFVIVVVSVLDRVLDWLGIADIPAFKSMRTLRALRPLKALSRFEGIRVVVNALIGAIPSIFNVLLVILVFWLIFSIVGVQLFGARFYKCVYRDTHNRVDPSENVTDRLDCLGKNFTWENSRINFDNVANGYLALFQVATFKGWIEIMADASDAREIDIQPTYEHNVYILLYFVVFIIFGSFFTLNLFVGVVIDNFNQQKRKLGEGGSLELFMTEDQKKYYNAMKKMGNKKPIKALPRPRFPIARFFFDLTTNQKFDIFIMCCILLNMVSMCLEHHNQSHTTDLVLAYVNTFFVAIFTVECVMKLLALHYKYFTIPWNVFDFVIVIISILGQALGEIMANYFVNPTLLRVARIARVGRILRLVKGAKGIRTLLFALAVSLPALFNIGLLLFLVMFIYSIFGMSFFAYVRKTDAVTDLFNFETFPNSMIILFQMCTKAGWSAVFQALTNDQAPDCDPTKKLPSPRGDCGNMAIAAPFLVTYVIITSLVVVNMYIAVILENFSQAQEDVQQGLTDDDYDMYYERWQRFDPSGSQFIGYDQLSEFVDWVDPPLRIPRPNHLLLVVMDLPICEGDRIHCVDILDGLTKHFLGTGDVVTSGGTGDAPIDIKKDRPEDYRPITTTLQRQRDTYYARIGLRGFRANVERRRCERLCRGPCDDS